MKGADEMMEALRPKLAELESLRQLSVSKSKKWVRIAVGIALMSLLGFYFYIAIGVAVLVLAILLGVLPWHFAVNEYKDIFKRKVFPLLAQEICPGVRCAPNRKISIKQFDDSQLFLTHPSRYRGEDYFEGKVGRTNLVFSEIHAEEKVKTRTAKGRTQSHYVTIFKGLFFITEFHKNFQGQTFVLPDFSENWLGTIGRKLQKWNWSRPDLVELENPDFEKHFVVYSTDQIEARYLITPDMMERILELKRVFGGHVHLSFLQSKLYIAIAQQRDLFEISFTKSLLNGSEMERLLNELSACFGLVEMMDLNSRIWSKK